MTHIGKGRALSMPEGIAKAEVIALAITMLLSGIIAWLVMAEKMDEDIIGYGVIITLFTASFLSANYAARTVKRRILLVCIVTGTLYWGILIICTFLFWHGDLFMAGEKGMIILTAAAAAVMVGTHSKK